MNPVPSLASLKEAARELADDVGLVDELAMHYALKGSDWEDQLPAFARAADLHWVCGYLAMRPTKKAQVKAGLLRIGKPSTKYEIAEVCGLAVQQVAGALGHLKSLMRAGRGSWGLPEWIEDEYEGIPAEIRQRIDEDGGSTRLNRLMEELPRMFGVSASSVYASVMSSAFRLEHGWVFESNERDAYVPTIASPSAPSGAAFRPEAAFGTFSGVRMGSTIVATFGSTE